MPSFHKKPTSLPLQIVWSCCLVLLVVCGCDSNASPDKSVAKSKSSKPAPVANKKLQQNEDTSKALKAKADTPPPKQFTKPTPPTKQGSQKEYTEEQLHKNDTTLFLALQPDIRARFLIRFVRAYLSPEQQEEAVRLLLEHDYKYQEIIKRRQQLLDNAVYGDGTAEKMRQLKIDTVEISEELRLMVCNEIMNEKQRAKRDAARKAAKKENQ